MARETVLSNDGLHACHRSEALFSIFEIIRWLCQLHMWPCGEMASRLTTITLHQEIAGSTPVSVNVS